MYNLDYLKRNLPDLNLIYDENYELPQNASCGFEIEFVNGSYSEVEKNIKNYNENNNIQKGWFIYRDTSVWDYPSNTGGEVVSPIIKENKLIWSNLETICNMIKKEKGTTDKRTAGHINIGLQTFENEQNLNNLLLIWSAYEDIIIKFFAGEFILPNFNNPFAPDCRQEFKYANFNFLTVYENRENILATKLFGFCLDSCQKYFRFEKNNRIEFRSIRGSLEEEIWQNNLNFILNLIKTSKNISKEELNYIKIKYIDTNEYLIEKPLKPEKAIEFANLIFENEKDQLYFLKQYFKDFKESNDLNEKFNLTKKQL